MDIPTPPSTETGILQVVAYMAEEQTENLLVSTGFDYQMFPGCPEKVGSNPFPDTKEQ